MAQAILADFGMAVGDVVDGKYRIERLLGAGGSGFVVAAQHLQLDEPRALKLLRPEALADQRHVTRFGREARAAAKIKGEHVCAVHDVGEAAGHGPYIAMELLEGCDLRELLAESGPLPIEDAVRYILQAGDAISRAHAAGIVHRDLKPGNLFLARRPDGSSVVKVVDFGISKLQEGAGRPGEPALTTPAMTMGSLPYLSPEQAQDPTAVDHRADLWGLGVVLYELLAGQRPFDGKTPSSVLLQVMTSEPRPIRDLRPDVPATVGAVLSRCLTKNREERYQGVGELAAGLAPFAPGTEQLVAGIVRTSPIDPSALSTISTPAPSGTLLLEPEPASAPASVPQATGSAATLFQPPAPPSFSGGAQQASANVAPTMIGARPPSGPNTPPARAPGGWGAAVGVGAVALLSLIALVAWGVVRSGAELPESGAAAGARSQPEPANDSSANPALGGSGVAPSKSARSPENVASSGSGGASPGPDESRPSGAAEGVVSESSAQPPAAGGQIPSPPVKPSNPLSKW